LYRFKITIDESVLVQPLRSTIGAGNSEMPTSV